MTAFVRGLFGLAVLIGLALIFSRDRKSIDWKLIFYGLLIQFILAVLILKGGQLERLWHPLVWPKKLFSALSSFFVLILNFTEDGATFVFGDLAKSPGTEGSMGSFFAFQVLPIIVFFASLTAILYHYGLMQKVVKWVARGVQKIMNTSGAETLSVISNIFIGQTEAPLMVKPYLKRMTQSELFVVMAGGMSTIAGSVMAAYVKILGKSYAEVHDVSLEAGQQLFAEHLLGASIMAAPAALVISKILYPEVDEPETKGGVKVSYESPYTNGIEAAAGGAYTGLKLAANVGAMLLAFIALLAMINYFLNQFGQFTTINSLLGGESLKLETIFGWILSPVTYLIGTPWQDAADLGSLLGTKIVLNEFVAYTQLAEQMKSTALLPKSTTMATFALCGFANFASIAIQIGGIGGLAPNRKSDLARFGLKAVFAGTLANLMTATLAGMLL